MAIQAPGLLPFQVSPATSGQLNSSDPGQVFTTKGTDFLSPDTVLTNIDSFSSGANNTDVFFGKNPSSADIVNDTTKIMQNILNANFGVSLFPTTTSGTTTTTTTLAPGTATAGITGTGTGSATNGSVVVATPSDALLSDLQNYNPLMWQDPSATNVNLGTMDAFNRLMGGNGIFTPPVFNNGPLYPYMAPVPPSFSNVSISTLGTTSNSLPEFMLFPNTAQTGSPLWNTTTVPLTGTNTGTTTIGGTTTGTTTTSIQPIAAIIGYFAILLASLKNNPTTTNANVI